jgi:hypothetical protein
MTAFDERIFPTLIIPPLERKRLKKEFKGACRHIRGKFIPIAHGDDPGAMFYPQFLALAERRAVNAQGDVEILLLTIDRKENRPDGTPWFVVWSTDDKALSRRFNKPAAAITECDVIEYVEHSLRAQGQNADTFYPAPLSPALSFCTNGAMAEEEPDGHIRLMIPEPGYIPDMQQMSGGPMSTNQMGGSGNAPAPQMG